MYVSVCVYECVLVSFAVRNAHKRDERNLLFFISMTRFTSAKCTKGIIKRMGVKQNNNINKSVRRFLLVDFREVRMNEWMEEKSGKNERWTRMEMKEERARETEGKTEKGGLWQRGKNTRTNCHYWTHSKHHFFMLQCKTLIRFSSIHLSQNFVAAFFYQEIYLYVCVCVYNICPAGYTNFITFYANWWFCYCCCCHYFCYYYCCSLLLSQINVFGIFSLSRGNCQ